MLQVDVSGDHADLYRQSPPNLGVPGEAVRLQGPPSDHHHLQGPRVRQSTLKAPSGSQRVRTAQSHRPFWSRY